MDELKEKIANYFVERNKQLPKPRENNLHGLWEQIRPEVFHNQNYFTCNQMKDDGFGSLKGKIFLIEQRELSAVFASYDDEILWLDDHDSNGDFERFVLKEHLFNWLPVRVNDMAQLVVKTKLNYLGMPMLIEDSSQITNSDNDAWEVSPPRVNLLEDNADLDFFVWTKIIGRVLHIHFAINADGRISFSGTQLTQEVGKWFIPR